MSVSPVLAPLFMHTPVDTQTVSAALGHTVMSGASPMHVDSAGVSGSPPVAGNNAGDKWRHDAAALLNQAADPSQFGKVLVKVLPEAAAACMQSQVALGKGPVKDRAGNTQESYTYRSFDAIYALQADPLVHMSSAGVGPAMAHCMKGVDGTEALVEMLENRNKKGKVQGIGDTAGRALMAGTLLLEFKVAEELVGYWKDLPPPLMPVYVRKTVGLGFDKTTLRREGKEMLSVLLYYQKGIGAGATVQTFQLAMEHIQYVFNADKTRIINGGELEMRTIKREFEGIQEMQLKLQELGIIDLGPNNGGQLMWEDVRFGGTDHAGECDATVRFRRNTINIACDFCPSPSLHALLVGTPLTSPPAPDPRPLPPYCQVPPPWGT